MDFSTPLAVTFPADTQTIPRLRMFLGHLDLRMYLTEKSYVDVGRGSFDAGLMVQYLIDEYEGSLGTIGQFCNCATRSELFGGGAHRNELPVNIVFTVIPPLSLASQGIPSLRPKPHSPFKIGNGGVISGGAKVMPGADIGDGVVLAAGAVASGRLDPFMIHGGVPAKPIAPRFADARTLEAVQSTRWWDFDTAYLGNHLERLQELAVSTGPHVYRKPEPRLIVRLTTTGGTVGVSLNGFLVDGSVRPMGDAPERVKSYFRQLGPALAGGNGPFHWPTDLWGA